MKISTKGRYAVRFLVDLAEHKDEGFVALKDVAKRQDISKKYLEQIVPLLNKSGILKANRGYQGGYMLAVKPGELTVRRILEITEGSIAPVSCLDFEPIQCERAEECSTLYIWEGLYKVITDYLDGITVQDIVDKDAAGDGYNYMI